MTKKKEDRQKEARYLSDKATMDSNLKVMPKDINGFYYESCPSNYGILRVLPENYIKWAKEKNADILKEQEKEISITKDEIKLNIQEVFPLIKDMLEKYVDMPEDYYDLIAIWIIGTYFHKEFYSYPYLFLNAMRGSGKTRLLKLITTMAWEGDLLASLTESVMFRSVGTLGIDELEGLGRAEQSALRELLNASYKKGTKIHRTKKKKGIEGEEYVLESFEPYRPVIMANINGMEEVLGDRCITLILEKSNHPAKTKLIELFEHEEKINYTLKKMQFTRKSVELCRVYSCLGMYQKWNKYIYAQHNTTTYNTLQYTTIHNNIPDLTEEEFELFNDIYESGIYGRDLELFMPLFLVAEMIGRDELKKMIRIASEITKGKREEQVIESRDVMVIDYVSNLSEGLVAHSMKQLFEEFKEFSGIGNEEDWLNPQWFGLALKRLKLILSKKRKGHGVEVMLDVPKAKQKMIMFK